MESNILKRIIKPRDLVLAFAIPTSKEDFIADLAREDKDFAANSMGGNWLKYQAIVLHFLQKLEPRLKKAGVTFVHGLTLNDFSRLFTRFCSQKVIVLFSHWQEEYNSTVSSSAERPLNDVVPNDVVPPTYMDYLKKHAIGRVEFADGLKGISEIIECIPGDYHGLLDLNVCRCRQLVPALQICRPNCYFRYKANVLGTNYGWTVDLRIMLHFYKTFIKHLGRSRLTYFDAYREVADGFFTLLKQSLPPTKLKKPVQVSHADSR